MSLPVLAVLLAGAVPGFLENNYAAIQRDSSRTLCYYSELPKRSRCSWCVGRSLPEASDGIRTNRESAAGHRPVRLPSRVSAGDSASQEFVASPAAAEPIEQPAYFVRVDFAIVNHVRSFNTEWDQWDRPRFKPSSTTWVSYWDLYWTPRLGCLGISVPAVLIARGWSTLPGTRNIVRCSDGWIIESTDGINVIARDVFVISSDYDFELKNRRCFRPLRKP